MHAPRGSLLACAAFTALVFYLDTAVLPETAIGALYAVPVAVSYRWRSRRCRIVVTLVVLSCIGIGAVRFDGAEPFTALVDRFLAAGVVVGTAVLVADMRKRVRRERQTRAATQRALEEVSAMVSAMRCIVIGVDDDGRIRRWEETAEQVFGLRAEQALGRPIDDCGVHWGEESKQRLRDFLQGEQAECRCELEFTADDGEVRHVGFTITAVEGEAGGYTVLGQDITRRLATEAEHRRLVAAVEQVDEAIVITDPNSRILYVNKSFERITGYTREEAIGSRPSMLKSGRLDDAFYHELWGRLSHGEVWTGRFTNRRKDGTLYYEDGTISPVFDDAGKLINFVGVKRDVTDRLRQEAQLRATQKLESIGQLASGIAHEINTPTQYISDNTRFLKEAFEKLYPLIDLCKRVSADADGVVAEEAVKELIELADRAGLDFLAEEVPEALDESLTGLQRVAEIVGAMKKYSHPGSGEKELVALNDLMQRSVTLCRNEWKYVADVKCDFDESLPPVPCLQSEIGQVIVNLLVNAAQAIEQHLEGSGAKGLIELSTKRDGDHVLIRVADSGCGMTEEVRARIFDPFFTTKEVGKGTGQGLAIAQASICEKHGGTIEVESEVGRGTEFLIRLPLEECLQERAA